MHEEKVSTCRLRCLCCKPATHEELIFLTPLVFLLQAKSDILVINSHISKCFQLNQSKQLCFSSLLIYLGPISSAPSQSLMLPSYQAQTRHPPLFSPNIQKTKLCSAVRIPDPEPAALVACKSACLVFGLPGYLLHREFWQLTTVQAHGILSFNSARLKLYS